MINSVIEIFLPAIFLTDVFIYLYQAIIKYLNAKSPLVYKSDLFLFPELKSSINPEREIPVYLIFLVFSIFLSYIYFKLWKQNNKLLNKRIKTGFLIKASVGFILGIIFLNKVGGYPLKQSLNNSHWFSIGYLTVSGLIITGLSFFYKKNRNKHWIKIIIYETVLLLIALITFSPKFPIYFIDYSHLYYPINEIAKGKTLFSQTFSQYGFLWILILGYLKRFSLFSLNWLPVFVWILYTAEYFISFYVILNYSQSLVLALMALVSLFTINYFSFDFYPALVPQIGPMRWFPLVVSLLVIYKQKNFDSKNTLFLLSLLSFLNIEVGVYLLLSYGLMMFILFLNREIEIKSLFKILYWLGLYLGAVFILINLVNILLGYQLINIFAGLIAIKTFSISGFTMLPLPERTFLWLIVFFYIMSVGYYFNSKQTAKIKVVLYNAQIMALTATYYVGRSHDNNLFVISTFFIIQISLLTSIFLKKTSTNSLRIIIYSIFFIFFVVTPAYSRTSSIQNNFQTVVNRLILTHPLLPEAQELITNQYFQEIELINRYFPEKEIVILHPDDAYIFSLINKSSLLKISYSQTVITKRELDFAFNQVYKACPKKILVDCRIYNRCSDYLSLSSNHYPSQANSDFEKKNISLRLNLIQSSCHINYRAKDCGRYLCIAEVVN